MSPVRSAELSPPQQAVSTERQRKRSVKRFCILFQETRQIHAGPGAGLRSALHRVRVPAPLLLGARVGDPDALRALLQLLSGRGPSTNLDLVLCAPTSSPLPLQPLSLPLSGFRHLSPGPGEGAFPS